ncbi:MAG: hypothetical protein ACK5JM_10515 [Rhodoblastus sp.]
MSIAAHDVSEYATQPLPPFSGATQAFAPAEAPYAPLDALGFHIQNQHHQLTPGDFQQGGMQRNAMRVRYAFVDARAASHETAPSHGPPKA